MNACMWFDGVVVVHEADKFFLAVFAVLEDRFGVPEIHEGLNDAFCLPIRLWVTNLSVSLRNVIFFADPHERMRVFCPAILRPIVRVRDLDGVRTLLNDLREECCRRILRLVRKNIRVEFS